MLCHAELYLPHGPSSCCACDVLCYAVQATHANLDLASAAYWDISKDWLNEKVGITIPGANTLTGETVAYAMCLSGIQ